MNADAYLNKIPLMTSLLCGNVGEESLDGNAGKCCSSRWRKAFVLNALDARLWK